jgi:hypothetical protein
MMTEDQLIKQERDCRDWLTTKDNVMALINEVRRLNAAIKRAHAATETSKPHEIREILETAMNTEDIS